MLSLIIEEERRKILTEDCGCGCNGTVGGCGDSAPGDIETWDAEDDMSDYGYMEPVSDDMVTIDREFLSREEALKATVAIAMSTSCPITRDALLGVVEDIM